MPDFTSMRIAWQPRVLSVTRIMVGLLFLEHGLAKILDFPHQPTHQPFVLMSLNPGAQGLLELLGGLLLVLGLFTRPVAFILAGDVAVAYFMAHAPRGFFPLVNGGELAIIYCFVFLYFWLAGAGAWGLDRLRAPAPRLVRPLSTSRDEIAGAWQVSRIARISDHIRDGRARAGPRLHEIASGRDRDRRER